MRLTVRTALAAVLCTCLTAAGAPSASASAAGTAPAAGETDRAGTACLFCVYNTVDLTNSTGGTLTLTALSIETDSTVYRYSYEQAIYHEGSLWLPRAGDTLEPGETRSYGVVFWSPTAPEIYLHFEDGKGRKTTFATQSWWNGGSLVTMRMGQGLWPLGGNAGPGQHTKLSIVSTG
ncbi:hypothetical protein [Streptomyces sp. NPDC096030]|uniref:hypothetical protein n=1 Tax=Streptomyces sp. NPDC096030 TaxID=3155423 RepID=UPI0033344186